MIGLSLHILFRHVRLPRGKSSSQMTDHSGHLLDNDTYASSPSLAPTWNPLLGQRVGEASHPGPRTPPNFCMSITVANITKLRKRKQAAISFWEEKQGILCLTETSADQRAERIVTKQAIGWGTVVRLLQGCAEKNHAP